MVKLTGHAEITCDMEDYGREPGDIVTVSIGLDRVLSGSGLLPLAICETALSALASLGGDVG